MLAQTTTSAPYDFTTWLDRAAPFYAIFTAAIILIAGLTFLLVARTLLRRHRLRTAFLITTIALAVYAAAWAFNRARMIEPLDPIAWWLHRAFAAALLFLTLRLLDRLALVPLLTRGGKIALPRFIHQILNILLALFAILIFGSFAFGWDIDRFLAGSAVVSIVLGLALQETLGNFFSGLVMQASPPFALGDWIICGDHEGRVVDMTWRAVTLHTLDDNFILIPNASVAKAEIINYHAPSTATARIIRVGLEYDLPPADAIAVLKAAALETPGVIASPEPFIFLSDFADSAVLYTVKFWINVPSDHVKIEHQVRVNAWYRLKERNYNIPFPIRSVEHTSLRQKQRDATESARTRRIAAIDSVPLLQPLSPQQKRHLADSAADVLLTTGQILFRQNDPGDRFYIIVRGAVDVLVTPEGATDQRQVATLGPGDFFGEMSALTGQPRTATIRAASHLALVEIEKQDLLAIFEADPSLLEKISAIVARRNAEREAILQGPGAAAASDAIVQQQQSLLGRMMRFFRLAG